jgi:protoheme IX farnesyltransferase
MKSFLDLTKTRIVFFVLLSGLAGYALSQAPGEAWNPGHLLATLLSLYFYSAGSFALNQAQEWRIDRRMPRTERRPIPSGRISALSASILGFSFLVLGCIFGLTVNIEVAGLGFATVVLYNLFYTLYWKKRWAWAAVPGALPGAMPVVIGYAANSSDLTHPEIVYAFLIMFLWQMPHFWALAIRFKEDYRKGGIPVLPLKIGTDGTLFYMGLYLFAYVALAVASPWFTSAYFVYLLVVVPFALKVLIEFFRYFRTGAEKRWLPFFLWTNFSVLVFLIAPVLDKWHRFALGYF